MGRKNQIYARYIRIMQSADNSNEIYLVLEKDSPMDKKYIRQFDNMFGGKDVILTIGILVRNKNKEESKPDEEVKEIEESLKEDKKTKKKVDADSPFWSVQDDEI